MNYLLLLGTSSLLASLPPSPPCLTQFRATPAQVEAGQPVLLSWTLTGGAPTSLTLEDDLSGAPALEVLGKTSRRLPGVLRRQTFTLKAANEAGTSSIALTVVARGLSLLAEEGGGPGRGEARKGPFAFHGPAALAMDAGGDLLVAETGTHAIRRVHRDGKVTVLAGQPGQPGSEDGPSAAARFREPEGLAVDPATGTVYVADTFNNAIRKITAGLVTTVAGREEEEGSQDGDLRSARFHFPEGIVARPGGGFLISDAGTGRIRTLDAQGVGTLASVAGEPFKDPSGLALDPDGGLFVADSGHHAVRQMEIAGDAAVPSRPLRFRDATKVVVDPFIGGALVADGGSRFRRVPVRGRTRALELRNVSGLPADLKGLSGLTLDSLGTLYAVDTRTAALLSISPDGLVGCPCAAGEFQRPGDLAVDSGGNVFVTDLVEATIRRVSREGMVFLFAGTPCTPGQVDGPGDGAKFNLPAGLAVDAGDNLIVADQGAHTIRKVSPTGYVTTLAGKAGEAGSADGDAVTARFDSPQGVAVDGWGNVYVADTGNGTVRKISRDGAVTTVAGVAGRTEGALGPLPGGLSQPRSVAVTGDGDLLVLCGEGLVQVTAP